LGVKILKSFDADPGSGIQDGKNSDPGFGMEKSQIRDKHSRSAILVPSLTSLKSSVLVLFVQCPAVLKNTITGM
jgi:hypothetical protein